MPYREHEVKKKYWTVGQVCALFNKQIAWSKIHYWESVGLIPKTRKYRRLFNRPRARGGRDRHYTWEGVWRIAEIHFLSKTVGMTIKGMLQAYELGMVGEIIKLYSEYLSDEEDFSYPERR